MEDCPMIGKMIKSYFKVSKRHLSIVLIFAMLISMPLFTVKTNAEETTSDAVTAVSIMKNKEKVEILATLTESYLSEHKGEPIYLFELTPYQNVSSISDYQPIDEAKANAKMTFDVSLSSGTRTRISSSFVIAYKNQDGSYTPLGQPMYISNPELTAANSYVYPTAFSKKGLIISDVTDAELLGVANTVITLPINEYFLSDSSSDTVSYLYNGKTFYFDRNKIDELDVNIRSLSGTGVHIYLNIVLSSNENSAFDGLSSLYFEDSDENALYYAINTANETGASYFEAFMKFISERYSNTDKPYGFAGSYIIGYNVNASRKYNSMGERELAEYAKQYASTFRTAYAIVKSSYNNANLFVSIANNFTAKRPEPSAEVNKKLDFGAKEFITEFNGIINASGNIGWNVAINALPSDVTNASQWADSLAESNLETPYITMANIDVLSRFLIQTEFLFSGDVRRIIVSEFLAATPEANENISIDAAQKQQAAAFAYAYYKAAANSYIDAIIYGRQIDGQNDGGSYGLWTAQPGTSDERNSKKYIYEIFESIDAKSPSPLTDFAIPIIGISSFESKIEGFSALTPSCTTIEGVQTSVVDIEKGFRRSSLFDFTKGDLCGFKIAENAKAIELTAGDTPETSLLHAVLDASNPYEYMGIDVTAEKNFVIDDSKYLTVRVKAEAPADVSTVSFMLRLYSGASKALDTYVYEGTAQIEPGKWTDVTFDVSEYIKNTKNTVKNIKIWIRSTDEKVHEGDFGFYLESICTWESKGLSVFAIIMIIIGIIVLGFAGFIGYMFLRGYLRRRRRRLHRQKIAEFRAMEKKRQEEKLRQTLKNLFPDDDNSGPSNGSNGDL